MLGRDGQSTSAGPNFEKLAQKIYGSVTFRNVDSNRGSEKVKDSLTTEKRNVDRGNRLQKWLSRPVNLLSLLAILFLILITPTLLSTTDNSISNEVSRKSVFAMHAMFYFTNLES